MSMDMSEIEQQGKRVHFVSLGCPKNRVDSEVMLGHLAAEGYSVAEAPEEADVIVVNTCAFIDEAKEESVDAITEMAELKKSGPHTKLVVAGCLSQRYAPELARELPEVDHFIGTGNFESIAQVLGGSPPRTQKSHSLPIVGSAVDAAVAPIAPIAPVAPHARLRGGEVLVPFRHEAEIEPGRHIHIPDPDFTINAASPRLRTLAAHSAYLKVSEGCSNTCAFCIIPKLRGPQRSRSIEDVVTEAERLIEAGAIELNLIAQDLCAYGRDLSPKRGLAQLLRALDRLGDGLQRPLWIRCLYAYPKGLTREVIDVLANARHIVPYLDMPLQHISDTMLRRMRRGKGGASTWALLRRLRDAIPQLTLRTTFITGMPGETEDDFAELCAFVKELRFERMGVFTYSREEDTPAANMPQQVPADIAKERQRTLMEIQKEISCEQQEAMLGRTVDVLVEGVSEETDLLLQGRHVGQAPDIDGITYINDGIASPGDVVRVHVDQASDYDIVGGIVEHIYRTGIQTPGGSAD